MGRDGLIAGAVLGALLALGSALQTAGLERTTVTNIGFITGLYVLLTPLFAAIAVALGDLSAPGERQCGPRSSSRACSRARWPT
jgi:drug/metabolite transporter (DMT)-like permease